jgi:GntR family transcriptional regulator
LVGSLISSPSSKGNGPDAHVVTVLDSSDPLPLWAQLAGELRRRLSSGEFDERFPTEVELTGTFGVSRATVREAIRRLRGEGLLDARRGSGTFVVHRQLDAPILGTSGLAQAITAAGLVEASKVLRIEEGPAGETPARCLRVEPHTTVQWVERLRYADGDPFALDLSAIALDKAQRKAFVAGDLSQGSLYGLLSELCGLRITGGSERLRAVTCGSAERKLLRPGRGEGVFEVERVAYTAAHPVEWRRSLVRGRGYVLEAAWGTFPTQGRR